MSRWVACLFAALACALFAWLIAPRIPDIGDVAALIAWIAALLLALAGAYYFVTGRSRTRP